MFDTFTPKKSHRITQRPTLMVTDKYQWFDN